MYETEAVPGFSSEPAPRHAARCSAGPARSMPWSIRAASEARVTNGRHSAIRAGDGLTCSPPYRRLKDRDLGESTWHGRGGPVHVTATRGRRPSADPAVHRRRRRCGARLQSRPQRREHRRRRLVAESAQAALCGFFPPPPILRVRATEPGVHATRPCRSTGAALPGSAASATRSVWFRCQARGDVPARRHGASPPVLLLSGIRPAKALRKLEIDVAADCLAVGQNLFCYDHLYRSRVPTLNDVPRPWRGRIPGRSAISAVPRRPAIAGLKIICSTTPRLPRAAPIAALRLAAFLRPYPAEEAAADEPRPVFRFNAGIWPCKPRRVGHLQPRSARLAGAAVDPSELSRQPGN